MSSLWGLYLTSLRGFLGQPLLMSGSILSPPPNPLDFLRLYLLRLPFCLPRVLRLELPFSFPLWNSSLLSPLTCAKLYFCCWFALWVQVE